MNNLTTYEYDEYDRLKKTRYPSPTKGSGTSSTTDYEQLIYDPANNVTSRRLRDANSIAFTYDNLNRVTLKNLPGTEPDATYGYDNLNRLTSATQTGYALTFGYDALSRQTLDGQGWGSISRQFDLAGNLTRTSWSDGFYVAYDRLVTGELTKVRENGASSGVGVLATYVYDDLGRRTSLTFGNGAVQNYTFDPVSRLASLSNDLSGTTNDLSATLAYNPASQINSTVRTGDTYAWNGHYNENRNYTANGLNQYTASGSITPTYDSRGNLTSAGATTYGYSSENLLTSATGGITLHYDPLGRLIEYDTSTSTRFMYDGAEIAVEVDNPAGNILRRYVRGDGSDEPLVWYEGSGTTDRRFISSDERGSIVSFTDSSGTLIGINRYDEYGIPQSTNIGRFQYTGQAWLPELGMQYSKARIYSPTLGRFLQTDPIGYADSPNAYGYVLNDPINLSDPSGAYIPRSICDPDGPKTCGGAWFLQNREMVLSGNYGGTGDFGGDCSAGGGPAPGGSDINDPIIITAPCRPSPSLSNYSPVLSGPTFGYQPIGPGFAIAAARNGGRPAYCSSARYKAGQVLKDGGRLTQMGGATFLGYGAVEALYYGTMTDGPGAVAAVPTLLKGAEMISYGSGAVTAGNIMQCNAGAHGACQEAASGATSAAMGLISPMNAIGKMIGDVVTDALVGQIAEHSPC